MGDVLQMNHEPRDGKSVLASLPEHSVAIVGMACHLPGARNVAEFWEKLREGADCITHFSPEELVANGVDPELLRSPNYVGANGVLQDMEWFDAGFFGLSPREAAIMDPQTRHILECAWEAFEHAGHVPDHFEGTVGVFAGAGAARYFWQNVVRNRELLQDMGQFLLRHAGNDKDFVPTRISYELDLDGPSVAIQTACSTSLVAVHYACQSLLSWECDMALAGAVTIEQPHRQGYVHEPGEVLSADGRCRSYDHASSGTVFGSGSALVLLRRLADAVEDGDTIHAVIRGTAVNNDGAGKVSYLAPSVEGQAKAITEALHVAGVEADSIGLVEGHGTGTPVGDPIEVTALTQAFRTHTQRSGYCALGSVKSNIGHLDTAAGVASLIKAALAVRHGEIPPTVHFERPNPLLQLESSPLYVNSELIDWPEELRPRRAGVTSLGIGGTNAHAVIEEPPPARVSGDSRPWQLVVLSARSAAALEDSSRRLVDFLESEPEASLPDVAHTLRVGRRRFGHRRALVCRSAAEAIEALGTGQGTGFTNAVSDDAEREVAFLFAGGGAQYPNMGRELYESERVFREAVDLCLDHHRSTHDLDLRPLLFCPDAEEEGARIELQRPSRALPALFAVQYAQARLWMSWGVMPARMIGHAMGEYTAACLAGVFSPQDGMSLVAVRGRLFETVERGGMLSVSLGEDALGSYMDELLSVAAVNAPEVSVAAGPVDEIEALEARLSEDGVDSRRIRIDVAAHSAMLDPILDEFGSYVAGLHLSPPSLPVISNLTGSVAGDEMATSDYWVRHLRRTVRFSDGVGQLMGPDGPVLLEVGPGRTLTTVAKMHPSWTSAQPALSSLSHPAERSDALAFQLGTLGALWAHGVDPDWSGFAGDEVRNRIPLPTYPFERAPYFIEPPELHPDVAAPRTPATLDEERRADPTDWFYKSIWVPTAPVEAPASAPSEAPILVLADRDGLGAALVDRLRTEGRRVVRVAVGTALESASDDSFTVRPGSTDDWRTLVQRLADDDALPEVAVHAWCLDGDGTAGSVDADAETARAFFAPLYLLQAVESVASDARLRLVAVTSHALAASPQDSLRPGRALLQGPVRVAPKELPSLRTRLVDVGAVPEDAARLRRLIDRLASEVAADSPDVVVAYRGSERLTERFVPVPIREQPLDGAIRDGGTYLITGGLGGLGLVVARELAAQAPVRLVLCGRTSLPAPDERRGWVERHGDDDKTSRAIREVETLERMGAEVLTVQADVTDAARMKEVVALAVERFGGLHGVVHAAGVLDDGPLLTRDAAQARSVLDPKVKGALAIDAAVEGLSLDFVLLFSSVSAVVGAPGQIDYTAANAFLDAYARFRSERTGQRTVSIGWGAWKDVGMAAELAGEARYGPLDGAPDTERSAVEHALFDAAVTYPDASRGFRARLAKDRHWMLDEHRVRSGPWVLPGSGYVELLRAALREMKPDADFALRDLVFLKPFGVGETDEREVEVRLSANGSGLSASVRGRSVSPDGGWIEHATATIASDGAGDTLEPLDALEARIGAPSPSSRPDHPVMDFGPRWSNIVAESSIEAEALLCHSLPEPFLGDLREMELHPALLDMATAGAQHLAPGVDTSRDLLVPAGYGALTMYRPLTAELTSHVVLRSAEDDGSIVSFDVTVYDSEGRPALAVRDFTMIRVDGDALGERGSVDGPVWLRAAISPAEGAGALRRVLAVDVGPHVLVATRPLEVLVQEASSDPVPARRREPAKRTETRVLFPDVAEALESHEAVAEATAIGTPDSESARVVAFVVYEQGEQATVSELRRFVRGSLGKERVPQNFVEMVSLPRGADGAVALEELRDPFAAADDHVAPRTATERIVAGIWSELLALDRVGIHDNFLDVGGHSLVGVRVLRRIQQETGVRIEANALTMQTLEQLAADVDRVSGNEQGNGSRSHADDPSGSPSESDSELVPSGGAVAER